MNVLIPCKIPLFKCFNMILLTTILLCFLPLLFASPQNLTVPHETKSKRTPSDQFYTQGEVNKAVLYYLETPPRAGVPELQAAASSPVLGSFNAPPPKPLALVQQPLQVFEQDTPPKQIAEQQVLYQFQQTPTNAVSNVHVKQFFQPNVEYTTAYPQYQGQLNQQIQAPQTLVNRYSPELGPNNRLPAPSAAGIGQQLVHQNPYNHGQHPPPIGFYNPFHSDQQHYQNALKQAPEQFLYANGKIVANPSPVLQGRIPQKSIYHKGVYHNQQKLPLINPNYNQRPNGPVLQPHRVGPQGRAPQFPAQVTHNRFYPPKQMLPINKPSRPVPQEQAEEEEEEPSEEDDEEEEGAEDDEEGENDGEERESGPDEEYGHERFPFEDGEYHEESESQYFEPVTQRSKKHNRYEPYNFEEAKRSFAKPIHDFYPSESRFHKSIDKKHYDNKYKAKPEKKKTKKAKADKYKKLSKIGERSPKIDKIQGRFSENIPVTHKKKLLRERWYVVKDLEGAASEKVKKIS